MSDDDGFKMDVSGKQKYKRANTFEGIPANSLLLNRIFSVYQKSHKWLQ